MARGIAVFLFALLASACAAAPGDGAESDAPDEPAGPLGKADSPYGLDVALIDSAAK